MTIGSTTNKISYSGDGTTTTFAYTFKIFVEADIEVTIRDSDGDETVQTLNSDYTVTGEGEDSGGNVVFTTAPGSTDTVILLRKLSLLQEADYTEGDSFPAATHEEALDKLLAMIQNLQEQVNRCIKVPVSDTRSSTDYVLPNETDRASKYPVFDSDGDISAAALSTTALTVDAFWEAIIALSNFQIQLDFSLGTDHDWSGFSGSGAVASGVSISRGEILYIKSDGTLDKAKANAASTMPGAYLALEDKAGGLSIDFLVLGTFRDDSWSLATIGGEVYVSDATAGALTQTAPTATGSFVQFLGKAIGTDQILFTPEIRQPSAI